MNQKGVIILGSSNSKGDTFRVVQLLQNETNFDVIDLNDYNIGPFDYEFKNREDDFIPLIKRVIANYEMLVFATPVYWYTMSATMKIFFDRLSDCLKIEKPTGKKLQGKKMAVLCCSSGAEEYKEFFVPFQLSAAYLGIHYIGNVHTWVDAEGLNEIVRTRLKTFASTLQTNITNL